MVGSFLNVVIYRLPQMLVRSWREQATEVLVEWSDEARAPDEVRTIRDAVKSLHESSKKQRPYSLVSPRSACPSCGKQITALENIPVLSWTFLKGRCSQCRASISFRYPLVEALTALLSGYVAWRFNALEPGKLLALFAALVFVWAMIALAFIDLDTTYLPYEITEPMLWLGILLSIATVLIDAKSSILGAVFGYLTFWSLSKAWTLIRKVESMGQGDFKLLAVIGSWLGWQMLPQAVFLSALVGSCVGITLIVTGRGELSTKIPFGPYLAVAGIVALLHGRQINQSFDVLRLFQ